MAAGKVERPGKPAGQAEPAGQAGPAGQARPAGKVVMVGTPIGNLGDLSPRAAKVLADADVICCEDTRHTGKLLRAAGIAPKRMMSMHQHNEAAATAKAVTLAAGGATVAVVSDAGMPGISDPGERLVREAASAGVVVEVVPGPSAFVAALVGSGLTAARFCFEGFLPRKGPERAARLADIAAEHRTVVIYESPQRVAKTIEDLTKGCGGHRRLSVGRELTKLHEEIWRGTLGEAVGWVAATQPRGEWVLVLEGAPDRPAAADDEIRHALEARRAAGDDRRAAVSAVVDQLGVSKRRVYEMSVEGSAAAPQGTLGTRS